MIVRAIAVVLILFLLAGCVCTSSDPTLCETSAPSSEAATEAQSEKTLLSNPNATETTKAVYEYLLSLSGNGCLAAQQESTWMGSADYEMNYILEATGKLPAMRGLDYMNDDFDGVNERAIRWWNEGGLVTICWHTGCDFTGEWSDAIGDTATGWEELLTPGNAKYDDFVAGMDKAAEALLELQEAGVTVLWRPFHEFDGRWFWWGKEKPSQFIRLWQMMYDRYTNHWGLNNLIWVLGYSTNGRNYGTWYPGDDYVDIVGADSYDGGVQHGLYEKLTEVTVNKPYCFHECGSNPTAEELETTPWLWFMTWHTEHITDSNTPEQLNALYNSAYVITRDELPEF